MIKGLDIGIKDVVIHQPFKTFGLDSKSCSLLLLAIGTAYLFLTIAVKVEYL